MSTEVVAIISSGVVSLVAALGTVGLTVRNARKQREHEATLAEKAADSERRLSYEGRAWDRKIDAHLEVIESLDRLQSALDGRDRAQVGLTAGRELYKLTTLMPPMTAYASADCLGHLKALRGYCQSIYRSYDTKDAAIVGIPTWSRGSGDPAEREDVDRKVAGQQKAMQSIRTAVKYDAEELQAAVTDLLNSTRASLRGEG